MVISEDKLVSIQKLNEFGVIREANIRKGLELIHINNNIEKNLSYDDKLQPRVLKYKPQQK